jgi:hypothetical protein
MFLRPLPRAMPAAACVGLLAAACLAAMPSPARAASTPGWRIVKVLSNAAGIPAMEAMAASGPHDAWASGVTSLSLVIEHWNGSAWQSAAVPGRYVTNGTEGENDQVIGSSSSRDMWTFPQITKGARTTQFALHWNGTSWKTFTLPGAADLGSAAVFGPSDAWAFGQAPTKVPGLGDGPPFAARFNGRSWRRVSMPGTPDDVTALSASDIWAFGPTTRTAINAATAQRRVAMHWNGRSWRTLAVPRFRISGHLAIVADVTALGRDSLWASEEVPGARCGCEPGTPGMLLAHWNGHRWAVARRDLADNFQGDLTSDGHGGLWLLGERVRTKSEVFLHLSGGRLMVVRIPRRKGFVPSAGDLALVPRTRSLWALADLDPVIRTRTNREAILKFGP